MLMLGTRIGEVRSPTINPRCVVAWRYLIFWIDILITDLYLQDQVGPKEKVKRARLTEVEVIEETLDRQRLSPKTTEDRGDIFKYGNTEFLQGQGGRLKQALPLSLKIMAWNSKGDLNEILDGSEKARERDIAGYYLEKSFTLQDRSVTLKVGLGISQVVLLLKRLGMDQWL
ncbi:hypothetical protein FNV43_RR00556 [Rhamnella rubrinervis]|uniref:Uncharacterized protein n=1 Tax=Rhamnella rubrinervis TaxID=2594499 RepID=A0A8K0HPT1_9ROSA|nr:hypothetical protein FNV43_RR00556 [Rhamnella rubrinervis]